MKSSIKKAVRALGSLAVIATLLLGSSQVAVAAETLAANSTDTQVPSDVENLSAVAGDAQVQLTWDPATDNVAVTGYKIYVGSKSVTSPSQNYDFPPVAVGDVKGFLMKNLANGKTYFFSATAIDAAGNESDNYAIEAKATPQSGLHSASLEDDGKAPQVKTVEAEDVVSVKVMFSEAVKLPEEQPGSAFKIETTAAKKKLEVQSAAIDMRDEKGTTVILTTAPQEEGIEYMVTAGIEIQDYFGNPMVSGTSDTGSFEGSAVKQSAPTVTTTATLVSAGADFNNRITVNFSEAVTLPADPASALSVMARATKQPLKVLNVTLSSDGKTAYLTTEPQQSVWYDVTVSGIIAKTATAAVKGRGPAASDRTPPEEVSKLAVKLTDPAKNVVELTWSASANTAKDLADQMFYQSEGRSIGKKVTGAGLGSSAGAVQVVDLKPGHWYTFKVTTKDTSGNESRGRMTSIYLSAGKLAKTGPEGLLLPGLTALIAGWYTQRRKGKK